MRVDLAWRDVNLRALRFCTVNARDFAAPIFAKLL